MTDNEIIRALDCCTSDKCTCSECSYEYTKHIKNEEFEVMSNGKSYDEWSCDEWLKCDLLDLINRQKAEIERLQERLEREAKTQYKLCTEIVDLKDAKAYAVKEFAERLHKSIDDFREKREMVMLPYTEAALLYIEKKIDTLVKEFTEGKDED